MVEWNSNWRKRITLEALKKRDQREQKCKHELPLKNSNENENENRELVNKRVMNITDNCYGSQLIN